MNITDKLNESENTSRRAYDLMMQAEPGLWFKYKQKA